MKITESEKDLIIRALKEYGEDRPLSVNDHLDSISVQRKLEDVKLERLVSEERWR